MKVNKMTSLDLSGKRVLIREDLNVPIKDGAVTSDARIRAALPTIQAALNANGRVMLMSHLGRPEEGKYAEEFSLAPVAKRLTQLLGVPVTLKRDWLNGVDVAPGEVVLLENVRFNKGEKKNADDLNSLGSGLDQIALVESDLIVRACPLHRIDFLHLHFAVEIHEARLAGRNVCGYSAVTRPNRIRNSPEDAARNLREYQVCGGEQNRSEDDRVENHGAILHRVPIHFHTRDFWLFSRGRFSVNHRHEGSICEFSIGV